MSQIKLITLLALLLVWVALDAVTAIDPNKNRIVLIGGGNVEYDRRMTQY